MDTHTHTCLQAHVHTHTKTCPSPTTIVSLSHCSVNTQQLSVAPLWQFLRSTASWWDSCAPLWTPGPPSRSSNREAFLRRGCSAATWESTSSTQDWTVHKTHTYPHVTFWGCKVVVSIFGLVIYSNVRVSCWLQRGSGFGVSSELGAIFKSIIIF